MHTQTIFELSQEAERLLQLALQNLDTLKSMPMAMMESTATAITGEKNNVYLCILARVVSKHSRRC